MRELESHLASGCTRDGLDAGTVLTYARSAHNRVVDSGILYCILRIDVLLLFACVRISCYVLMAALVALCCCDTGVFMPSRLQCVLLLCVARAECWILLAQSYSCHMTCANSTHGSSRGMAYSG
jgi:hypothetical protein